MTATTRRALTSLLATAFILFFVASAFNAAAGTIGQIRPPFVTVSMGDGASNNNWRFLPTLEAFENHPGQGDEHKLEHAATAHVFNGAATIEIDRLEFDPDPFVLNNILVTNTSATTQLFSAFVGLPTTFPAPNFISGTITASVIDGGAAGATLSTAGPGSPMYQAQIDGVTVASMLTHLTTVTSTPAGSDSLTATFGPTLNLVPVTSNIGIQLRFTLSAGDTAAILSRFDVVEIPEPATWLLAAVAAAAIAYSRRRPT
jgi:hypothetical protein